MSSKTVLGNETLISVGYITEMLSSFAPNHIDKASIDWRAKAEREIKAAEDDVANHPGSLASAELMFNWIFDRVLAGQITWV
jgi:hypothetical protein